jgi:protein TonB
MNAIEEQRTLVEYLELAVDEARKSGTPEQAGELEQRLKEARWEYARLKVYAPSEIKTDVSSQPSIAAPPELKAVVSSRPAVPATPDRETIALPEPSVIEPSQIQPHIPSKPSIPVMSSEQEPRLIYEWEPRYKTFINNLKSAFSHEVTVYNITANPVETDLVLEAQPWYKTLVDNIKLAFRGEKVDYSGITSQPIATDLLLEQEPWFLTILSQFKVLFFKVEKPAIDVTAQPVEVDEIFKEYKFRSSSVLISTVLHAVGLLALLVLPIFVMRNPGDNTRKNANALEILVEPSNLLLPPSADKSGGGGGGGRRDPTPASKGKLPRPSDIQLTPPTPKIVNLDPILPAEPTVIVPQLSQLPNINLPNYGDPNGVPGPPSSGPGTGGGIGTGTGGGVGPGEGGGVGPGKGGGIGGGVYRVGGGVTPPTVLYRVEPTYSEEARKAKYQGVVVLSAIVRKDGTIEILKVVRGLGLGLDENAISALRQWRFRPGMRNGVPVDVALNIEVNFSLR